MRRPAGTSSEATIHLLEDGTVQSLTIEAIAREAGVGKATIYRWWDSKALVVIDAFIEHHIVRTPMPRDLPPADALAIHFAALVREYAGWSGRIVAQIIAEGQADPAVLREFRERFHYGRRAVVREVLEQWRREGSIPAPSDIEVLSDLIYAPDLHAAARRPLTARRHVRPLPSRLRVPAARCPAPHHRSGNLVSPPLERPSVKRSVSQSTWNDA